MTHYQGVVHLRPPHDQCADERYAEASAEIPHEIEDAGGISHLVLPEVTHRRGCQRNKDEANSDSIEHARPDDITYADLKVDVAEPKRSGGQQHKSKCDQNAIWHLANQTPHYKRRNKSTDASRAQGHAALQRRIN